MTAHHCPCGNPQLYTDCCQPLIEGQLTAVTAEQLMRSRYSAYLLGKTNYLVNSWHPETRPDNLSEQLCQDSADTQWLGLTVLDCPTAATASYAYVRFFARYQHAGRPGYLYETSRFLTENNQWYYLDGVHHTPGRNETCPCGSGLKFKRCCLKTS